MKISGKFPRVRNRPILVNKKPEARGFEDGGFWKVLEIVPNSLKRRLHASKLADFEQKAWAIAHGFEDGGFWKVRESFQTHWNAAYMHANGFLTTWGMTSHASEIGRFWAKSLGLSRPHVF